VAGLVLGAPELGMLTATELGVWGDPIGHSRSPLLHAAAYEVLGLPWSYGRRQVDEAGFEAALDGLDATWRGLSLTMPLKQVAARTATALDDDARRTGAVNTLLLVTGERRGFNTDVGGLARALTEIGVSAPEHIRILGAGATATSALVAAARLGAQRVEVRARRPEAVRPLVERGASLGVQVSAEALDAAAPHAVHATIATLPGGTDVGAPAEALASVGGPLVDVVYGGWPTPLARAWERAGAPAFDGRAMLLHQALLQVRVFVGADAEAPLDREDDVLAAMRAAVMGD